MVAMPSELYPLPLDSGCPFEWFCVSGRELFHVGGIALKLAIFLVPGAAFVGRYFEVHVTAYCAFCQLILWCFIVATLGVVGLGVSSQVEMGVA